MGRIIAAGFAAAIAMFIWNGVAHSFVLESFGFNPLNNDAAVIDAVKAGTGDRSGMYYAPGSMLKGEATAVAGTPGIFIVYSAMGPTDLTPKLLISEFALELIEALLLAALLARLPSTGFGERVAWATAVGIIAVITTNGSYVVWYDFPVSYSVAYGGVQLVGFIVAGIVAALILPKRAVA